MLLMIVVLMLLMMMVLMLINDIGAGDDAADVTADVAHDDGLLSFGDADGGGNGVNVGELMN